MAIETIKVPDIGGAENVDVIEICFKEGDTIEAEESIIVLESDKASMDIPSPVSGTIKKILIKEGDKLSEGAAIAELEVGGASDKPADAKKADAPKEAAPKESTPKKAASGAGGGSELPVQVPDIGGAENVDVIEVSVKAGDDVAEGDTICVLESDKASMDIPSPASGTVKSVSLKEGAKVSQGADILVLAVEGSDSQDESAQHDDAPESNEAASEDKPATGAQTVDLVVPDIGGAEGVDVIEVCVKKGDTVAEGESVIVLESDKASMDIPAEQAGEIVSISVKEGDKLSKGDKIGEIKIEGAAPATESASAPKSAASQPASPSTPTQPTASSASEATAKPSSDAYAGPAVRKLAREMAVDLSEVTPTGPRGRIIKDDVKSFVKTVMTARVSGGGSVAQGSGIPAIPAVDFSKFGEIEKVKMSKIQKVTAANMLRNWLNVPHVTQFDDVDISEMEAFRKGMKAEAEKAGVKLTPLPFLIKAAAAALRAEPSFNVSIDADGEHIVKKNYVHIGVAVDTPNGLMVPVIRDADKKGLFQLASETLELAKKARDGKLMPKDMQGGCFTISSLGAIGGTGFTPIVNAPEVAILGVSRADTKPVWNGKEFEPRLMLPLCLSYDHRAINGGDAGRFFTYLNSVLSDVRRLLL